MRYTLILTFLFSIISLHAQNDVPSFFEKKDIKIKPVVALQLWSTYTFGTEIYNKETQEYVAVNNRFNTQLRRSRLGFKGQIYKNLKFNLTTAIDLVGKDNLAGTEGSGNNGSSPQLRLWNAYIQWQMKQGNENFNLTAGYIPPQIGRESITSAFRVTSMEKSWSQNYLRRHLVGTGPGRATGVNIGGLFLKTQKGYRFKYDLGVFNPTHTAYSGSSAGKQASPLFLAKFVTYFGEPESKKYTTSHKINYFGQRDGLSVSLSVATQGETDLFNANYAAGADFLWNKGNFNLDGEWTLMWREGIDSITGELLRSEANTGYLRMSYNFSLKEKYIMEPVLMFMQYRGAKTKEEQVKAQSLNCLSGLEQKTSIGLNFYLSPDFKLSLNYTFREADAGANAEGTVVNNYYYQKEVGAIKRGDWVGVGLVVIL